MDECAKSAAPAKQIQKLSSAAEASLICARTWRPFEAQDELKPPPPEEKRRPAEADRYVWRARSRRPGDSVPWP
jgi:hypothetical protein